jgi:hypothetical protein
MILVLVFMSTGVKNMENTKKEPNFIYNEDGTINWRAMIPKEFLVPNKQIFERKGKPVPNSIDGLEDKELLILLGGIKFLSRLKGVKSVRYPQMRAGYDFASIICEIEWVDGTITSGAGDAKDSNTNSFAKYYLTAIAENRAFIRAARFALNLDNLLGYDEIGQIPEEANKPNNMVDKSRADLLKLMNKFDYSLPEIRTKLVKMGYPDAEKYKEIQDIPAPQVLEAINILKNIK